MADGSKQKLMHLDSWAVAKYGQDAPGINTLRRWARDGLIVPTPVKQGRSYYVREDAEYLDFKTPRQNARNPLIGAINESAKARRA